MTEPYAKIILDSTYPNGTRLTTIEVKFHRFILSEFNTHRVFSRNSASSRAIPVDKQLDMVISDPAYPLEFRSEKQGMSGGEELDRYDLLDAGILIEDIHNTITSLMKNYLDSHKEKSTRLHKSILNRYLEPFMWQTVIVTSTAWQNFFNLRFSEDAQPELRIPAELMKDAYNLSCPKELQLGDWHTPYVKEEEYNLLLETRKKISVARCARVSYLTHDGTRDLSKDLDLYEKLLTSRHMSPFEHIAIPDYWNIYKRGDWTLPIIGNFVGWSQFRHLVEKENSYV